MSGICVDFEIGSIIKSEKKRDMEVSLQSEPDVGPLLAGDRP
jgi:hypothetical protein